MKKQVSKLSKQSGVVLVVSLFMLLLLSLIGLSGMQSTMLEEKMASNSRDQNIAFQAAEAALREGELFIREAVSSDKSNFTTNPVNANGLHLETEDVDYKAAASWGNEESVEYSGTIPLVAAKPRFYIEYIKDEADPGGIGMGSGGGDISYFSVIAKGTGQRNSSQVYLRSIYARKF